MLAIALPCIPKANVCGVCPECRDGLSNLCSAPDIGGTAGIGSNGGMAAYVSIPAGKLRSLPDEVSLLEGAWVEPIAVALRGVSRSGFKVGRRAVVVGAGPIGLLTVMHLRLGGASQITVLEPSEMRRAKAEELGADITINPITDDPTEIFGNDIERPDYAFECSAAPSALDTAVEILAPQWHAGAARRCNIPDQFPLVHHHSQGIDRYRQFQLCGGIRHRHSPARAQGTRCAAAHQRCRRALRACSMLWSGLNRGRQSRFSCSRMTK